MRAGLSLLPRELSKREWGVGVGGGEAARKGMLGPSEEEQMRCLPHPH